MLMAAQEEKAARDAAVKEGVKTAVASQKFKINVTSVTPMRATISTTRDTSLPRKNK